MDQYGIKLAPRSDIKQGLIFASDGFWLVIPRAAMMHGLSQHPDTTTRHKNYETWDKNSDELNHNIQNYKLNLMVNIFSVLNDKL